MTDPAGFQTAAQKTMQKNEKILQDKIAVVTGASRGIGRSIAVALAKAGAHVVLCARNETLLNEVEKEILALDRQAVNAPADVTEPQQVQTVVKKTLDTFGRVDILVNNAGIVRDNLIARMTDEQWDSVLSTNLKSTFLFISAVTKPMMRQRAGRIINISSVIGVRGNIGQANYAASKAGIIALTKSAARELGSRNILVNAIAPGFITTDMTEKLNETQREGILKEIPLQRLGEPKDIAEVAVFLASERARYITGQVIHVDGGMVM